MNNNRAIKNALKKCDVSQYELADAVGVSEYTLCKHLRKELTTDETERLLRTVEQIAERKARK